MVDFARDVLEHPLDPWQEWCVVHAMELLPDGRPRFRVVHVQVARQNGKTELPVILSLYWQTVERVPLILGTSTKIDYAKESWMKAVRLAERAPGLRGLVPAKRREWCRQANGEQESVLCDSRYKIAAANEEGGRSLTIHRLILDELRQHHDYSAWDAAVPAMNAVPDAQVWCLSNAGTDRSVVLNDERDAALRFIESGEGDYRTGWFEWSAPEGASPLDLDALAQANPNLGYRIDPDGLLSEARKAVEKGGEKLAGFRTESMCQRVPRTDPPPIPVDAWDECADPDGAIVAGLVLCVDVALDRRHSSIGAAGLRGDGCAQVEVVEYDSGTEWVLERLAGRLERNAVKAVVFDPGGPVGSLKPDLVELCGRLRVPLVEMTARDQAHACGALHDDVVGDPPAVRHLADPVLTGAVVGAAKRDLADAWAFSRRKSGPDISPLVAVTGALWGVRGLPGPSSASSVF